MVCEWWTGEGMVRHTDEMPDDDALDCERAWILIGGQAAADKLQQAATRAHGKVVSCRDFIWLERLQRSYRGRVTFLGNFAELRTPATGRWGFPPPASPSAWPTMWQAAHRTWEDPRIALDRLRNAIDAAMPGQLRLHATADTWLGANDARHLARVTPRGTLLVVRWA